MNTTKTEMTVSEAVITLKGLIDDHTVTKDVECNNTQREAVLICYNRAKADSNGLQNEAGKYIGFYWSVGSRSLKQWVKITFPEANMFHMEQSEDQTEVKAAKVQAVLHKRKKALSDLMDVDPWRNVVVWDYPAKKTKKGAKA